VCVCGGLCRADLIRILAEKDYNLVEQTVKLMQTEGVDLEFTRDGVEEMAGFAEKVRSLIE
jgi:ATP-dependent HslUV protease ATP-binding subunit HslU